MKHTWKWIVPVMLNQKEECFKGYLDIFRNMQVDMALLVADSFPEGKVLTAGSSREYAEKLREKREYFESNGIRAGCYMGRTIGHSAAMSSTGRTETPLFREIVGPEGDVITGCYCPLDKNFQKYMAMVFKAIALSDITFILIDDDFRMHQRDAEEKLGCFCPLHIKEFNKRTGLQLSRAQLVKKVICGKPNTLRDKWLTLTGDSLIGMAKVIERAVHSVNTHIRIGLAVSHSHWFAEGIEMMGLLKALSGGTKPFIRILGAPYGTQAPDAISHILEYTRLQYGWIKKYDVEVVTEGDTFPHTRFYCSATMLHSYTQFMLASGMPGILYMVVAYSPKPDHETGYIKNSIKYITHYEAIRKFFPQNYEDLGLNVVLTQNSCKNLTASGSVTQAMNEWPGEFIPPVLGAISRLSLPLKYNDTHGPTLLSGHNVSVLKEKELDGFFDTVATLPASSA